MPTFLWRVFIFGTMITNGLKMTKNLLATMYDLAVKGEGQLLKFCLIGL